MEKVTKMADKISIGSDTVVGLFFGGHWNPKSVVLAKHLAPPPRWTLLWEARVGVARPTSAEVGSTAILAFWLHAVLLMFACCYLLPEAAFLPLPLQEQAPVPKKTRTKPNARLPFVVTERTPSCAAAVAIRIRLVTSSHIW